MMGYGMGYGMMYGPYGGGGWMFLNFFFWILAIAGIVLFIAWIFRHVGRTGGTGGGESALEILKKRYARGEINREEFERIKKDIL